MNHIVRVFQVYEPHCQGFQVHEPHCLSGFFIAIAPLLVLIALVYFPVAAILKNDKISLGVERFIFISEFKV